MKISYVLPAWNAEHIIFLTIKSILNQTIKNFELIIINDGSTDRTEEIIKHFLATDTGFIKYHKNETREGAAVCRNFGNSIATGDIIAVCDCDSYMKNRSEIITEFFTNTEFHIFHSSIKCVSADDPSQEWIQEARKWNYESKCPISHPTVAYKKEVADKCKYHEKSIETDLFEFMLLDAVMNDYEIGGAQDVTCVKYEGDTERDRTESNRLKREIYAEYGIEL